MTSSDQIELVEIVERLAKEWMDQPDNEENSISLLTAISTYECKFGCVYLPEYFTDKMYMQLITHEMPVVVSDAYNHE